MSSDLFDRSTRKGIRRSSSVALDPTAANPLHASRRLASCLLVAALAVVSTALQLGGCGGGGDMTLPDGAEQSAQQADEPVSDDNSSSASGRTSSRSQPK